MQDDKAAPLTTEEAWIEKMFEGIDDQTTPKRWMRRRNDGVCPNGHPFAEFGRVNIRGHLICNRCNAEASARSYACRRDRERGHV